MGPTPRVLDNIQTSTWTSSSSPSIAGPTNYTPTTTSEHPSPPPLTDSAGKPCRQMAMTIQPPISTMRPTNILPLRGMAKRRPPDRFAQFGAIDKFELSY